MIINCRGKLLDLSTPTIMGVININIDSFYDKSRTTDINRICEKAIQFINDGASIIDLGVMSSRPGAVLSKAEDEIETLVPILKELIKIENIIISIDTVWSSTAKTCIENGASIINDISGGTIDHKMLETVASFDNVPFVMMHMRGTPETMNQMTDYNDLVLDIINYFSIGVRKAKLAGIKDIILDPGFGFAKTLNQSYTLLNNLDKLKIFDLPILAGLSRKSMIYKLLGTDAENSLNGTSVVNTIALMKGANILRVHDVKEAYEAITIFNKMN